jgi:3-dehydroquinate synthase
MANSTIFHTVSYTTHQGNVDVFVGENLHTSVFLKSRISSDKVLIISDENISPLYLSTLKEALNYFTVFEYVMPSGEMNKDECQLLHILSLLSQYDFHRDDTLIALGGGVVTDLTGLVASLYRRGVHFIQMPTSLLAMVDASIGGKTAINYAGLKNNVGSFYHPSAIIIDVKTLTTLPERELNSGMAEIIKHAILEGSSSPLYTDLLDEIDVPFLSNKTALWANLIFSTLQSKLRFVLIDPFEMGGTRALLNLGHTIGHAIEASTDFNVYLHGEAVSIGLYYALVLSERICSLSKEVRLRCVDWFNKFQLPYRLSSSIDRTILLNKIQGDKKIKKNVLRFVLCRSLGDCYIDNTVSIELLSTLLTKDDEGDNYV